MTELLTRTAHDVNARDRLPRLRRRSATRSPAGAASTSPPRCKQLLSGGIPPRDRLEPNDDAGDDAAALWGRTNRIEATLDFWDDQNDVYAIRLQARGQPVFASVRGPAGTDTNLILWRPGTKHVDDLASLGARRPPVGPPGPAGVPRLSARRRRARTTSR